MAGKRKRYSSALAGSWLLPFSSSSSVISDRSANSTLVATPQSTKSSQDTGNTKDTKTSVQGNPGDVASKPKPVSRYSSNLPAAWVVEDNPEKPGSSSGPQATPPPRPPAPAIPSRPQAPRKPAPPPQSLNRAVQPQSASNEESSSSWSQGDMRPSPPPAATGSSEGYWAASTGSYSAAMSSSSDGRDLPVDAPSVSSNYSVV